MLDGRLINDIIVNKDNTSFVVYLVQYITKVIFVVYCHFYFFVTYSTLLRFSTGIEFFGKIHTEEDHGKLDGLHPLCRFGVTIWLCMCRIRVIRFDVAYVVEYVWVVDRKFSKVHFLSRLRVLYVIVHFDSSVHCEIFRKTVFG